MWEADRVVLAAGSWSSQITVQDADTVPVKPIRGQLIQLQADAGALRRVLWGPNGYLVPWPDGSLLVGSTVEDVGFDESHTDDAVRSLRAAAVQLVPSLAAAPMTGVRTGLRPRGPDDLDEGARLPAQANAGRRCVVRADGVAGDPVHHRCVRRHS